MSGSALDTPMMRQYVAVKAQHPDAIVFYRMGDFYEMFLDDAELAAPLLDITLTTRDKGKADAVPMCGIPVHSADDYIRQLAALGHRVAICEQVENPKQAGGRRLVKREVVEVVTPGLVGDPSGVDAAREVALAVVAAPDERASADAEAQFGLAVLDASTGDFRATSLPGNATTGVDAFSDALLEELERIAPKEILVAEGQGDRMREALGLRLEQVPIAEIAADSFEPAGAPVAPEGFDPSADADPRQRAAAGALAYLAVNQPFAIEHAPRLLRYELRNTMVVDAATRAHLELFESSEDGGRRGTLVECLDRCETPLGSRKLGRWIAYPLLRPEAIAARQDGVATLAERDRLRARLREALSEVRDLERLLATAMRPGSQPRDLGKLRDSLEALPDVAHALSGSDEEWLEADAPSLPDGLAPPVPLGDLAALLRDALIDDPPAIPRGSRGANETGYVREGFRPELDGLRESAVKGREWIAGLEASEREKTGIANLKARFHPVHGYSLEVSKAQLSKVPERYERKQTLASVERFTTAELREMEGKVVGANDRAAELEREIVESLRESVAANAVAVRAAAARVAEIDALASLAEVARQSSWVRPVVDDGEQIDIRAGRHPVVESMLGRRGAEPFVPNDTALDTDGAQLLLLTGPNMSGKSTYLRQVALLTLLAQIGSYVPAESAAIGAVDRIFTRVGASDRLARGESTFMVEMRETAEILSQASRKSLVILDEIGRGTSTYDGLAIAWAVAEYLHDTPGLAPRTLFATHYHELTELAATHARVRNAHFAAREWKDEVVFLRQLVDGGANRSYGIQVARLAGVPTPVIERAQQILAELEAGAPAAGAGDPQLSLALGGSAATPPAETSNSAPPASTLSEVPSPTEREALEALEALDPDRLTPLEALEWVHRFHAKLKLGKDHS